MKELIGRHITSLEIDKYKQEFIKFNLVYEYTTNYKGENYLIYKAIGDCCSESWFADIIGVEFLLDATVSQVDRIDMPEPNDGRTRQEEDEAYCYRITTNKGVADVVFRCSSNGYYGGWLELWEGEVIYFKPVLDDYSA